MLRCSLLLALLTYHSALNAAEPRATLDDIVKRLSTGGRRTKIENVGDDGTVDIEELLAREDDLNSAEASNL